MAHIILVTGGTRSGKSDYAQKRAEKCLAPRCFVATCAADDNEMTERINKHREARKITNWDTIEESINIENVFKQNIVYQTILIDCVTLWISNIMEKSFNEDHDCDENHIASLTETLLTETRKNESTVIFVTNEVGMGIVPKNAIARRYRDLVGRCNRILASHANEVVLISCGLPLKLK